VPKQVSAEEINKLLLDGVKKRLEIGGIAVGNFLGGAQIRLKDKKMTLDISDNALKELIANYGRRDFRKLIFGN
jgi:V/A-type H+-transporting ATPase subunit E